MKMEKATRDRIIRNVVLSLFIFLLPIALMFITFKITGQRPWKDKAKKADNINNTKSVTNKININNGSND